MVECPLYGRIDRESDDVYRRTKAYEDDVRGSAEARRNRLSSEAAGARRKGNDGGGWCWRCVPEEKDSGFTEKSVISVKLDGKTGAPKQRKSHDV